MISESKVRSSKFVILGLSLKTLAHFVRTIFPVFRSKFWINESKVQSKFDTNDERTILLGHHEEIEQQDDQGKVILVKRRLNEKEKKELYMPDEFKEVNQNVPKESGSSQLVDFWKQFVNKQNKTLQIFYLWK